MAETKDKLVTLEQLKLAKDSIAIPGIATTETAGIVKPDGTTITVDPDGVIKAIAGSGGGANIPGGTAGQLLAKASESDNDFEWVDPILGRKTADLGGLPGYEYASSSVSAVTTFPSIDFSSPDNMIGWFLGSIPYDELSPELAPNDTLMLFNGKNAIMLNTEQDLLSGLPGIHFTNSQGKTAYIGFLPKAGGDGADTVGLICGHDLDYVIYDKFGCRQFNAKTNTSKQMFVDTYANSNGQIPVMLNHETGAISWSFKIATTSEAGFVKPDGATITVDPDGTIKAVGGGGGGVTYSADEVSLHLEGTQFSVKDGGITAGKIAEGVIPEVATVEEVKSYFGIQ